MTSLNYQKAYEDTRTLCALSLNVFIGDWIDNNDATSPYYKRMINALTETSEICDTSNITTFSEHELILKKLVTCNELFCEVMAETTCYHKYLPFKKFLTAAYLHSLEIGGSSCQYE